MTEEKYTIRKYKRILFYVVICVLLAAFLWGQYIYPSEREPVTEESITYTGTFYRELPDGTEEEIRVPDQYDVPAGELMVIRSVLPQDYNENTIAIRSSLENVRIYIGGELRTVYDPKNTRPFGKNSASGYVFCETSGEDAGQEVRIELQSFTEKYSGVVNTVYCGDKLDIWGYIFHCYFMVTLIACTMLFSGLVVLIISLVLDIVYKTRFDLEYLGWCMILGAVWMLGESKLRQLFVPNASILSNMCFFVVMLCPVPIMFYIDSVQQGRYRKVYHVAECITCVNLVLCTALQVLNIADFISTMFLSHMVIAGTFLTVFITICRDLIQGTAKHYKLPLIGLVAAMIAVMLEVTAVYRVVSLSGIFIATGLVVLLVVTLIQTMDRIRELELARQREARESLDYLTGLPMRHKGEKLILEKMQEHDGCLGFVDMDNLKKINDVYGHKAGDRALRLVGAMLTECMENAVVCRLGGDEFLFYLPEVSEVEMNTQMRKLFDSFEAAKKAGFSFQITRGTLRGAHPNTVKIEVVGEHGSQLEVIGSSVGGGRIRICEIDGIRTDFSGEYNTIIVHNTDTPGHVAQVTTVLAQKNVNIAAMQLYRNTKGGYAVMILECDDRIPPDMVRWLSGLDGILKITSYNAEEDV